MGDRAPDVRSDTPGHAEAIPFERTELDENIVARFGRVVARCGPRTALAANGEEWSYDDLDRRSSQVARAVHDRVPPGPGCVAYLVGHSANMVICALGVLKAGKTYLCVHPQMPAAALRDVLRDASPCLLIADAAHEGVARDLCGDACPILPLDAVGDRASSAPLDLTIEAGAPAVIFYTSGSTGRPKGVVKSHATVLHRAWLCARHDLVSPADRQSLLTYCSFASSEADCFGALLNGAALELFDVASRGFGGLGDWIDARQITLLHPPVVLLRRYLSRLEGIGLHPSVRLVALAGETVLASDLVLWRRHFATSCALRHRFSSTEAGHVAVGRIEPHASVVPDDIPLAYPVEDKFLSVVDSAGLPVGEGSPGELVVRSRFLADGYWRRDALTAEQFQADEQHPGQRVFHTGDLVRLHGNGLEFVGRQDAQVKINGYRVEIAEIERALLDLPGVKETAVIAEPRHGAAVLIAFVVMRPGELFRADAMRRALRSALPAWKVPVSIYALDALPLTLTGKVDRQGLRDEPRPEGSSLQTRGE